MSLQRNSWIVVAIISYVLFCPIFLATNAQPRSEEAKEIRAGILQNLLKKYVQDIQKNFVQDNLSNSDGAITSVTINDSEGRLGDLLIWLEFKSKGGEPLRLKFHHFFYDPIDGLKALIQTTDLSRPGAVTPVHEVSVMRQWEISDHMKDIWIFMGIDQGQPVDKGTMVKVVSRFSEDVRNSLGEVIKREIELWEGKLVGDVQSERMAALKKLRLSTVFAAVTSAVTLATLSVFKVDSLSVAAVGVATLAAIIGLSIDPRDWNLAKTFTNAFRKTVPFPQAERLKRFFGGAQGGIMMPCEVTDLIDTLK